MKNGGGRGKSPIESLGGGFKDILFSPLPGEMIHIFQMDWNHKLVVVGFGFLGILDWEKRARKMTQPMVNLQSFGGLHIYTPVN